MSKLRKRGEANIPTDHGVFKMQAYAESFEEKMPHLTLINPDTDYGKIVNVRVHSECMTGDLFGSNRCECGEQLNQSLKYVSDFGGLIIYLRQEGRGIGLINKLHAYVKQDEGLDTAEANLILGHEVDSRKYDVAKEILNHLAIKKINLITNNPEKIKAFETGDIEIVERIALNIEPKSENLKYLETKKNSFGHFIENV